MKKISFLSLAIIITLSGFSQAYSIKTFNWNDAGFKGTKPTYFQSVNIMSFGGNNTNSAPNNTALNNAITALGISGGVVYFPKGVYSFTGQVSVNRDSITFKGAGYDSTQLRFNLSGVLNNCINVYGSQVNTDTTSFTSAGVRDSNWVNVLNAGSFSVGQWVYLQCNNDVAYMSSSWAYGSLGQIMQIKTIVGNKITFNSPFRFYYKLSLQPKIKKIIPRKAIGFECMKVQRLDATSNQTSLFSFDKAVQCWINGIEGDSTNYSHVELNRCSNIDITNSYFHHSFAYGSSGQGYGIALQYSANECKVENNVFQNLRHSMLFQAGANGNVCGYNYSFNPYWNEFPFPTNSAGDIVFHGNYPFANLCEGNINQNTVIDNSHAKNGPYNTLFRNRSELYGVFMNTSPATDTTQFLGLEVTNAGSGLGLYTIVGNGNLQYGNMIKGVLTPASTNSLTEKSLYYSGVQRPLCFNTSVHNWSILGIPNMYNSNSNAAKDRAMQNHWADCVCSYYTPTPIKSSINNQPSSFFIYPNPAQNEIKLKNNLNVNEVCIYSMEGKLVLNKQGKNIDNIDISELQKGIYLLCIKDKKGIKNNKFVKE
ncbi:MAG: T9SS type A sorting domain-containing protein [Bacteroidota bacterium]|nr:T9SS type A sorting domain-containing protein [Bacteroidota bacterium]